jgi:hypothetical protein
MTFLSYKGQRYDQIGETPYTRKDGGLTTLAVWSSLRGVRVKKTGQ